MLRRRKREGKPSPEQEGQGRYEHMAKRPGGHAMFRDKDEFALIAATGPNIGATVAPTCPKKGHNLFWDEACDTASRASGATAT